MVPVFSKARVRGEEISLTETQKQNLLDEVRDAPYRIMNLRGSEESSRWVTGHGVSLLARTIYAGGVDVPLGLSTPLAGEYGFTGVSLSVPVTLDKDGIETIETWKLSHWEEERLENAFQAVAADCR
jgi:malate dehydrogenase